MTRWRHNLKVGDLHAAYQEGSLSPEQLGNKLAKRILSKRWFDRYRDDLEPIVSALEDCANIDEYDEALEDLYDWADQDHRCWVSNTP